MNTKSSIQNSGNVYFEQVYLLFIQPVFVIFWQTLLIIIMMASEKSQVGETSAELLVSAPAPATLTLQHLHINTTTLDTPTN